jgi:hypothetical protein
MDAIHVQAPDGSIIQFPAGTPDATINSVMSREFGNASRASNAQGESGPANLPEAGLAECSKGPELRTPIRSAAHRIDPAATQFRGAPSLRALDLLQELEPDIQKGGAPVRRPHRCFSRVARPSPHGARIAYHG